MSQFVALSTSTRDNVGCTLAAYAEDLVLDPVGDGLYGVGYYDSGELLARVSPRDAGRPLDVAHELAALRADVLVLHTGAGPGAAGSPHDDAQPFRFQDWLMTRIGPVDGFAGFRARVVEAMPPFIRRGMRGDTAAEHFFHLFLSFLFDAGRIGRNNVGTGEIRCALGQAIAAFDAFAEATGRKPSDFSAVVSDGYSLVAAARGVPTRYALVEGVRACRLCRDSRDVTAGGGAGVNHDEVRGVLVVSGVARPASAPFAELESGAVLSVTADTRIELHSLGQLAGR
jgi:glutamine amidotransferase